MFLVVIANANETVVNENNGDVNRNDFCETCVFVVEQLQEIFEDPYTREDLKTMLKEVCKMCSSVYGEKSCKIFIDHYYDDIINVLLDNEPLELCQKLHVCSSKQVLCSTNTTNTTNPGLMKIREKVC